MSARRLWLRHHLRISIRLFYFVFLLWTGHWYKRPVCAVLGKGEITRPWRESWGLPLRLYFLISLLFFCGILFLPGIYYASVYEQPGNHCRGSYLFAGIIFFSFVFMGFAQIFVSALRSVGKVVFPSVIYVVSLLVNVFLNATFIFGLFGAPKLGVVGVALGTVTARAVEAVLCLIYSAGSKEIRFRVETMFQRSGVLFKDFLKISAPSVINDLVWGLAASMFTVILGHIGDDMVAANAVAVMVVNIGAIVCRGFANATTIIVSQSLGNNKIEETKVYAGRMLRITFLVSLLGSGVILAIRPFMIRFYSDKLTETAISYLGMIMIMTTWRLVGEAVNTCLICGCFRGGGDAKFGMILDTVMMWCVAVPLMAIAAYVLKLPPIWVYFVMTLDEFEKMPIVFIHYFKFKWLKNITRDRRELEAS